LHSRYEGPFDELHNIIRVVLDLVSLITEEIIRYVILDFYFTSDNFFLNNGVDLLFHTLIFTALLLLDLLSPITEEIIRYVILDFYFTSDNFFLNSNYVALNVSSNGSTWNFPEQPEPNNLGSLKF
jgi:hypothetical protein